MKHLASMALWALFLLAGCTAKAPTDEGAPQPVTDVEVTHVTYGSMTRRLELTATTAFLRREVATAPISAFITACHVQTGTAVRRGQPLYRLESKERQALGGDLMGGAAGVVYVRAAASGVVTDVQQQAGGYVTEGTALCTIADAGSQVFEVDVPAEDMPYARPGTRCLIALPDGRRLGAVLQTPLATMDVTTQVQQVPARAKAGFLPEGLRARATLTVPLGSPGMQLLPKAAVQSDAGLTSFWIVKVTAHGTAARVDVQVAGSDGHSVAIAAPRLSTADRIVASGAYGLQEGDRVRIVNAGSR
jgi:multidrug efflux pump subunit AcrA (membrane-fusion protein)